MTTQEAIEILTEMRDWNDYITQSDALQMAIDELEKKPAANSEDAISRQAVMDGLEKYHDGADLHIDGLTYAYDLVCKLPSVSTEKTGRWKRRIVDSGYNADWSCSVCGYKVKTDFVNFKYCPNCGARMVEPQESEKSDADR
jgi:rubrerythrin